MLITHIIIHIFEDKNTRSSNIFIEKVPVLNLYFTTKTIFFTHRNFIIFLKETN